MVLTMHPGQLSSSLMLVLSTAFAFLSITQLTTTVHAFSQVSSQISNNFQSSSNSYADVETQQYKNGVLLNPEQIHKISRGGIVIIPNWLPQTLTKSLHSDAINLFQKNKFKPDGLTNTALGNDKQKQGFSAAYDRQTFRGADYGWTSNMGDLSARLEFKERMDVLRSQLSRELGRPTLATEGITGKNGNEETMPSTKHEMTYNWYEPGAKLGCHLDEHHEETKGIKGWTLPTRRSVTWLVYLNNDWKQKEGGALQCFLQNQLSSYPVGAHNGNLQVGWLSSSKIVDGKKNLSPVFLDAFRPSGSSALYRMDDNNREQILSTIDFDVPSQPIDFTPFLQPQYQKSFQQISTATLDPRFVASTSTSPVSSSPTTSNNAAAKLKNTNTVDVVPSAGTLVVFDSVSVPHLVQEVTGGRQRVAATGWFHEDSQFQLEI